MLEVLTFEDEFVDLDGVFALFVDGDLLTEPVVLGRQEDACGDGDVAVAGDVEGESERLVVEALDAGMDVDVLNVLAVVQSVQHVHVEVLEESGQVVDAEVVDLDAGNFELFSGVVGKAVLVLLEDVVDVLVQAEEGGVSGGRLEVFHDTGRQLQQSRRKFRWSGKPTSDTKSR